MDCKLESALLRYETDLSGVRRRFEDNEALYVECLKAFLDDTTMEEMERAINGESWDEAFTAAHALKGLAGNMGFVPLYHSTAEIVVLIRGARTRELPRLLAEAKENYTAITQIIRQFCVHEGVGV